MVPVPGVIAYDFAVGYEPGCDWWILLENSGSRSGAQPGSLESEKWWLCIIIRFLPVSILRLYDPYKALSQTFKRRQHAPVSAYCLCMGGGDLEHTLCDSFQNPFTRLDEFGSF